MNEDKRIIELTATSELDSTDFLPIDNSKSSSEENSGTRKIRVQTLLDSTLKVMLTQAEYNDLPSSKLTDGKVYYITDESKIIINGVVYGAGGETVADVYVNGTSVVDLNKIAQIKSYKEVTQAEYDALPSSKLTDNILYCIKDGGVAIVNDVQINGTSIVENGVADIGVDNTPTYNSTNLVTSGGVHNAITPLQQQIGWLASAIEAEWYSGSNTYNVGDYVWQNGSNSTIVLYKCIATTTGSWDSSKWEPVTVTSELQKKADKTYVDESIDKLLVHGTASGEIASFSDGADFPMPKLEIAIEPQQDLHGYDSPWVGGAGKNKLKVTATTQEISGVTFTVNEDGTVKANGTATDAIMLVLNTTGFTLPSGNYKISAGVSGTSGTTYFVCSNYASGQRDYTNDGAFTSDGSLAYRPSIYIVQGVTLSNVVFKPMIRLATVSDATFAPYSNICPISGWSGANVTVCDDVSDPTETHTTTIQFTDGSNPLTVYGGTLDVSSGELVVDRKYYTIDGNVNLNNLQVGTNTVRGCISSMPDMKTNNTTINTLICDKLKTYAPDYIYTNDVMGISENKNATSNGIWLRLNKDLLNGETLNDMKTWFSNNNVHIVYILKTPLTIQLTPTQVKSLLGSNNVWADCGEVIEANYIRCLDITINDLISRVEALEG